MKTLGPLFFIALFFSSNTKLLGQDSIFLRNPSFEDLFHAGTLDGPPPKDWSDCGHEKETPPDIHGANTSFFGVKKSPVDGMSYLGLVTRNNRTWEGVGQKLENPLVKGQVYLLTVALATSSYYRSPDRVTGMMSQFNEPVVLRIWGGQSCCNKDELFAETAPIENEEWLDYDLILRPLETYDYLLIEAYYPSMEDTNGNVLVDHITIKTLDAEEAKPK